MALLEEYDRRFHPAPKFPLQTIKRQTREGSPAKRTGERGHAGTAEPGQEDEVEGVSTSGPSGPRRRAAPRARKSISESMSATAATSPITTRRAGSTSTRRAS